MADRREEDAQRIRDLEAARAPFMGAAIAVVLAGSVGLVLWVCG